MKKIIIVTAFVLGSFFNTQKSEAGIILGVAAGPAWGAIALPGVLFTAGAIHDLNSQNIRGKERVISYWLLGIGAGLLVLDADGSLNQECFAKELSKKYPLTENEAFYSQVASLIKEEEKNTAAAENGSKIVHISREKMKPLLECIDTQGKETEVEQLLSALE